MYKPLDITTCPAAFLFLFLNAFFRGHLSQVHHPSRNVNYRKEIGALDSFVGHLIALLVHLRQVYPLKAPSAVWSDSLKRN